MSSIKTSDNHTPRPWRLTYTDRWVVGRDPDLGEVVIADIAHRSPANAHLISAAPDLKFIADSFEVTGPDDDGLIWLVLHGNGTTGKAMFNLGSASGLAAQVALSLERDRRAAVAKATGEQL